MLPVWKNIMDEEIILLTTWN